MIKHFLRAAVAILMLGGLFANGAFREGSASVAAQVRSAFALPALLAWRFIKSNNFALQIQGLDLENQSLRAELELSRLGGTPVPARLIHAKVFAVYPFNDRNAITIARGSDAGIKEGAAVMAVPGIFLGEVSKVYKTWSEVRTVFDATREIPVRVGPSGVQGLLRGGSSVSVSMLDKTKHIEAGDSAIIAQAGLPYGLKVGEVRDLRGKSGTAWNEAELSLPYALSDLTDVFVVRE